MTRPTVVDVFAGVGGLGLGFEQAGFDVVAAVEIDPIHAATHTFNFARCRTILPRCDRDSRGRYPPGPRGTGGRCRRGRPLSGILDDWETRLDDPRNQLVRHFLRLVVELEPSVFVLENVRGLTVGKHRRFLDEVADEFQRAGYSLTLPWQVLNARDYGVPQDRKRLFLLGAKGVPTPRYPLPEIMSVAPTCLDALDDLPNAEYFDELHTSDSVRVEPQAVGLNPYARAMRCLANDAWHFGYVREWDPALLTGSLRTAHTEISRRRVQGHAPGYGRTHLQVLQAGGEWRVQYASRGD